MRTAQKKSGCLVCGKELAYLRESMQLACALCHATLRADARCANGHFVCDACHADAPGAWIVQQCRATDETDPMQLAIRLMRDPCVAMHGPEHHVLVPAVLLTAYCNLGKKPEERDKKLAEALKRARCVAGGSCGFHGACGAAIGVGIFASLVLEATPLSKEEYRLCNEATAQALARIAAQGGPRCCKRAVFTALQAGAAFSAAHLGRAISMSQASCEFFPGNRECLGTACAYFARLR